MQPEGKRYYFKKLMFWAENGMICIEDSSDASFRAIPVREFLYRIRAINSEIHKLKYSDEKSQHHKFVADGLEACREAKEQGRPDDPAAVADILKQRRKNFLMHALPETYVKIDNSEKVETSGNNLNT